MGTLIVIAITIAIPSAAFPVNIPPARSCPRLPIPGSLKRTLRRPHGGTRIRAFEGSSRFIEYSRKSLALKPDYPNTLCNLGVALVRSGGPAEGLEYLERSRRPSPWCSSR